MRLLPARRFLLTICLSISRNMFAATDISRKIFFNIPRARVASFMLLACVTAWILCLPISSVIGTTSTDVSKNKMVQDARDAFQELIEYLDGTNESLANLQLSETTARVKKLDGAIDEVSMNVLRKSLDFVELNPIFEEREKKIRECLEAILLLTRCQDSSSLDIPINVDYLHYFGLKLTILSELEQTDWDELATNLKQGKQWWRELAPSVKRTYVHDAVDETFHGMETAVAEKNIALLRFAAMMHYRCVEVMQKCWNG